MAKKLISLFLIRHPGVQDPQLGPLGPRVPQGRRLRRWRQGQLRRHQGGHGPRASRQRVLGGRGLCDQKCEMLKKDHFLLNYSPSRLL